MRGVWGLCARVHEHKNHHARARGINGVFKNTPVYDARQGTFCEHDAQQTRVHEARQWNIPMHNARKPKKP